MERIKRKEIRRGGTQRREEERDGRRKKGRGRLEGGLEEKGSKEVEEK